MTSSIHHLRAPLARAVPIVLPKAGRKSESLRHGDEARRSAAGKGAPSAAVDVPEEVVALARLSRHRGQEQHGGDLPGGHWIDQTLEDDAPSKAADFKASLLSAEAVPDIRGALVARFPDPSDAILVLRSMLLDEELEEHHASLRLALDRWLMELDQAGETAAMRGGINVAIKSRLLARSVGASARSLREAYREFLGATSDPLGQYEAWIDLFGFDRRFQVIDFIEQALAADMYSLDPSCSRLEFGRLLKMVRRLTTLRSADRLLLAHCWQAAVMARIGVDKAALLRALLAVIRHGGGLEKLDQTTLYAAKPGMSPAERAIFAQGLRRAFRALPHELWYALSFQVQALDEVELQVVATMALEDAATTPGWRVAA